MKQAKWLSVILSLALLAVLLSGCAGGGKGAAKKDGDYRIAVVSKSISDGWFQRMGKGIEAYNKEHGTDYFFGGPTNITDQATYLEQLLAEDWDAICIVPFDTESIAPLLEKARDEGVVIITHEADSMDPRYFDYDIEPFQSTDLGRHYGEYLVEKTGGEGTYIQFVGSLNSVSHNTWCDAADEYIAAHSNLAKLGRYESNDDLTSAYNQVKELLQAHPEINAIQGSASTDIAGASHAVEELGLAGKVAIIGTSLYSVSSQYLESGTLETFSLWDSSVAGQAMVALAERVLKDGESFDAANCSLPLDGYEKMVLKNKVFYGTARVDVTLENRDSYNY